MAFATTEQGEPVVYVDLVFLGELWPVSDLAAVAIAGLPSSASVMEKAGFDYGQSLARALSSGNRPLPRLEFKVDSVQDPMLRITAKHISPHVMGAAVAWVVLHEIGHHRLGHLKRNPVSLAESREWELAADQWAFEQLDRLGYSMLAVDAFLQVKTVFEQFQGMLGVGVREENSTHPSFTTRASHLEERWKMDRPPRGPLLVLMTAQQDVDGNCQVIETWVPRARDQWYLLAPQAVVADSSGAALSRGGLVIQWNGSDVNLYGRNGNRLIEWIVHDLESVHPHITIRERTIGSVETSESTAVAIQLGTALDRDVIVSSMPLYRLLEITPRSAVRQALQDARVLPELIPRAEFIQLQVAEEGRVAMMQYARGDIDLKQFQSAFSLAGRTGQARMRQLLGEDGFARLQMSMFENPLIQAMGNAFTSPGTKKTR